MKQSYKSVLSFSLSGHLLGICSLDFYGFWCGVRDLCEFVHDRAGFSNKMFSGRKMGKWGKKTVFQSFSKILSLL